MRSVQAANKYAIDVFYSPFVKVLGSEDALGREEHVDGKEATNRESEKESECVKVCVCVGVSVSDE